MKNITLFKIQQKYPSDSTAHVDELSLEKTFSRLLSNFIENKEDSFILLETIVLSCITIEAIIRENLREINPALLLDKIDAVDIAIMSHKRDKLIIPVSQDVSNIKTANISILLERYLMFYKESYYKKGINSLFSLRNKILHAATNNVIDKHELTLMLTRSIFPFIKSYVKVSKDEWDQIEKIKKIAYSAFKSDLVRKLIVYKKIADKLTIQEKDKLYKDTPQLFENESILAQDLLCPACKYQSVTLKQGIDFDWNPDGTITNSYYIAVCRVCEIDFDSSTFEEIAENPDEYFDANEIDQAWSNIISEQEHDIGDYISEADL